MKFFNCPPASSISVCLAFVLIFSWYFFLYLVLLPPHLGKKCRGGEGAVGPLASTDTGYTAELPVGHTRYRLCLFSLLVSAISTITVDTEYAGELPVGHTSFN